MTLSTEGYAQLLSSPDSEVLQVLNKGLNGPIIYLYKHLLDMDAQSAWISLGDGMSEVMFQKIADVVAAIRDADSHLDLNSLHLSCLAILYLRQSESDNGTYFSVQDIEDAYERACALHHIPVESLSKTVTHLIDRYRKQNIFILVDGSNFHANPEYTFSHIGASLGTIFSERLNIRVESFVSLADAIISKLNDILSEARSSSDRQHWEKHVMLPLETVARELMHSIELRQKSFDDETEKTKARIADLLEKEWIHVIHECEEMIGNITDTFHELYCVIQPATEQMELALEELAELARGQGFADSVDRIRVSENKVQLLSLWATKSFSASSKYYQRMHGFIQSVVRTDPNRIVAGNLTKQIAGWFDNPFYLLIPDEGTIVEPGEFEMGEAPVKKTVSFTYVRQEEQDESDAKRREAEQRRLEELVDDALKHFPERLSAICERVGKHYQTDQHYGLIGRIAQAVSKRALIKFEYRHEKRVALGCEIEDWHISGVMND
jgi:chromosome condensin MukBEF complex kleisin-like MukF subunit